MKIITHLFALPELPPPNILWAISYYQKKPDSVLYTYFSNGIKPETTVTPEDLEKLVTNKEAILLPKEIELVETDTLYLGTNGRLWRSNIVKGVFERPGRKIQIGYYNPVKHDLQVF